MEKVDTTVVPTGVLMTGPIGCVIAIIGSFVELSCTTLVGATITLFELSFFPVATIIGSFVELSCTTLVGATRLDCIIAAVVSSTLVTVILIIMPRGVAARGIR